MNRPDHYLPDLLFYFDGKPLELSLYAALEEALEVRFPEAAVKVQKSQISFYNRHLFAAASLPVRRKKTWPEHCLLVTFGLPFRLDSPRIAAAVEPCPNRWTHHVVLSRQEEVDRELLDWIAAAYDFSLRKR